VVVVVVAGAAASLLAITVGITTSDTVRPEVVQVDQHLEIASVGVAVASVITVVVVVVEDGDSTTPVRGRTARPDSTCPWCTEDVCFDAEAMRASSMQYVLTWMRLDHWCQAGMNHDDAVQLRLPCVGVYTAVWLCIYEYIHEVSS
jgi:hypothetical protein